MTAFAALFAAIDATTATSGKVAAIRAYLATAPPADAAWAVFFLTGRRLKRLLSGRAIAEWAAQAAGVAPWLMRECTAVVGDQAEAAALVLDQLPTALAVPASLADWIETRVQPLRGQPPHVQRAAVLGWLPTLPRWHRFTLLKLLTGEFRAGVSQTLVVRAVAEYSGLPATVVAARLTGSWTPSAEWFLSLIAPGATVGDQLQPYPFALASPLDTAATPDALTEMLGMPADWHIEWKWDGIRAQVICRRGEVAIWSRGDELITARFPDIVEAVRLVPDGTVLDGEILAWRDGAPLPFALLQQRIGRHQQVARVARAVPVTFMAYDLLESAGEDLRDRPLNERRARLEQAVGQAALPRPATIVQGLPFDSPAESASGSVLQLSAPVTPHTTTWEAVASAQAGARQRGVEGLMLKRRTSAYEGGRKRGHWWKWKVAPYSVDAVLIYAQPGSGKRASLLTDYTFGLWDGDALVPVAKAYSGLSNDEIAELDRWIRRHTMTRFGPVRHVEPVRVMELGFEGIARSSRHRSGVAVRFPRILRLRPDKRPGDADSVASLHALIDRR